MSVSGRQRPQFSAHLVIVATNVGLVQRGIKDDAIIINVDLGSATCAVVRHNFFTLLSKKVPLWKLRVPSFNHQTAIEQEETQI